MGARGRLGPLLASSRTARPQTAAVLLGEAGALVALIGSLMPWGTGDCYTRDHGMAMLPVLLVAAALLIVPYFRGAEGVPFRLAALGAMGCGILVAVFAAYHIADVSRLPTYCEADYPVGVSGGGAPAVGLYVTLAGGIVLALGSLGTALARPRARYVRGAVRARPHA